MKNKIFKLFSISLSVASISVTSFAIVSCGNKDKNKNSWNDFNVKALNESAMSIIAVAKPANWSDVDLSELSMKITANSVEKSITATMDRTVQYENLTTAVFEIDFIPGTAYNVNNWECTIIPKPVTYSWSGFKDLTKKVSASDLLAQAKRSSNWKDLKWTYGTDQQNVWVAKDQPEFDIYGGNGGNDPYKGMAGEPTVDETNHTVTAIISKKNQEGLYDSDPIEATIKYNEDQFYNISGWTFKTTEQLQSYPKWKSIYRDQINMVSDFNNFENNNWLESVNDNTEFQKQARNRVFSIDDVLNKTGYSAHNKLNTISSDPDIIAIVGGYEGKTQFNFGAGESQVAYYTLIAHIKFKYQDPTNLNGPGTAFHHTWFGEVKYQK